MNGYYTGLISSVDRDHGFVKVTFPTENDTVSDWLPLLYSEYNLPEIGTLVAVVVDERGNGVCLGKIFSYSQPPKVNSGYYKSIGGAEITENNGAFRIQLPDGCCITNNGRGTLTLRAANIILDGYTPPES